MRSFDIESAEADVIGGLFDKTGGADEALARLMPADFADAWNRAVFEVALSIREAGREVSAEVIARGLKEHGLGATAANMQRLSELGTESLCSLTTPQQAVDNLRAMLRLQRVRERVAAIRDPHTLDDVLFDSLGVDSPGDARGPVPLGQVLAEVAQRQHQIASGEVAPEGYTTGSDALDEHFLIRRGDLHCIAACTGVGKSWLLHSIIRANALNPGRPVRALVFSLEMDRDTFAERHFAMSGGVNSRVIGTRHAGPAIRAQLQQIAEEEESIPVDLEDQSDITVREIAARVKIWKRRYHVEHGIVGVDFAQLVNRDRGRDETNADALQRVAYALRRLAQSERLAIIATAQLNREGEKDPVPRLEYIEGGGGLGRALALGLGIQLTDRSENGPARGVALHVLKHRHGQSGQVIRGTTDLSTGRFVFVGSPA